MNISRFMMVLAYLETEEGGAVNEADDITAGKRQVGDLLEMPNFMAATPKNLIDSKFIFEGLIFSCQ